MGSRTVCDPYGGLNPLVDKVIGPRAYEIVKFVALRMGWIQKVAAEPYTRLALIGQVAGTTTNLLFPPTVTLGSMFDSAVWLTDPTTGIQYGVDSGYFSTAYSTAGVTITLKSGAPAGLQIASIKWSLTAFEANPIPPGVFRAPIA